ncbi:MAG TPA: universal stress protein [Vicinamibacteria bacterium]|nr:universal stress protein [Vicinamibacteria bacterium]
MGSSARDVSTTPSPLPKGPVFVATNLSPASDEAVRQADALARALGVPLVACHVLPELLQVRMLFPQLRDRDRAGAAQLEAAAGGVVRQRVQDLTSRGPEECTVVVESGSPHAGILRQAEKTGAGITVLGPGRVAERVVRTVCCAMLIARPSPRGSVLAATDFSDPALPAVVTGAAEAVRRGVGFAVIHSVDVLVTPVVAPLAGYPVLPVLSPEEGEALRAATLESLRACLERVQASGTPIVAEGPAVTAILEAARTLPAELVVVGTHGRTGMTRLALGSVAEDVVRSAPCSTLVVRLHPA